MLKSPFDPCIPSRGTKVPDRPEWIHEIKHDGSRPIIQREGKRVRLWTRNSGAIGFRSSPRLRCATAAPRSNTVPVRAAFGEYRELST